MIQLILEIYPKDQLREENELLIYFLNVVLILTAIQFKLYTIF